MQRKMTILAPTISRRTLCQATSLGVLAGFSLFSHAATWPERTVRVVIPFPPGGTSDVVARLMAERLSAAFGQPVIVDAKPGANGIIATDFVAKSSDGHTFLFASAAHASNASLYPKLPYDTTRDFLPVAQIVPPGPMVIAVHAALPVRSVAELIDYAKKNPGTVSYASAGIGNTLHLAGEMLSLMANIKMLHVPYRGAAPALTDLAGGQVNLMFNSALAVAPFVKDGKLRLIAQTGAKRSSAMSDLPTVQEQGLPGFEVTGWFGLFAPAKTPPDVVQRLNAEINRVMALPELREKLVLLGSHEVPTLSPSGFSSFVNTETVRYAAVIKAAGVTLALPSQ
jgi:tripartite-type tricarboxylate transporter receptor subunit TctC